MQRNPLRRDLGLQLLALYLLFIGPVVLASLFFDRLLTQRLEADVKAADLALARAIAQETNTTLDGARQAVLQLGEYPAVINSEEAQMATLFAHLMDARPDVNLVYRLGADGIMLFHYPTGPGSTVGVDFSYRDYFERAQQTNSPIFSIGRISPTTNQPVTTAVMPLWSVDQKFLGLVATNIKLQALSTTLSSIAEEYSPAESFDVAIIDAAGHVIAHPDPALILTEWGETLPEVTAAVLAGNSGNLIQDGESSEETLYSYVPIPSANWGVIIRRPTSAAFVTPRAIHSGVLLVTGIFILVGVIFWIALSRQVLEPLERLAAFSRSIGEDEDFSTHQQRAINILSERHDQIGHLIHSLRRMESAIQARLQELSTLLQTSAAVVSSLEPKTVLNTILEQVEHLMGIQMCAIIALDERRGIFRAQASRGLSHRYVENLAISPTEPHSVSMRAIRSGEPVQVSDTEVDASFAPSRPRALSEGYRSVLAVPLITQHAPPSVLLVYRPDPHVFSEREIKLLSSFANHAAMAIENAALYARSDARLREQTRRLEALVQSLQDGLILEDLQGNVLYANRSISTLVDLPIAEIVDLPVTRIFERLLAQTPGQVGNEPQTSRQQVLKALEGRGARRVEFAVVAGHSIRYLRLQVFDVTDAEGQIIGRGQILRDITQNREIDRMKSSLISTVSHELRTPLAAIKGYVSTLLAEDVSWDLPAQREFLEIISKETDRLKELVNDLLDMSRIEAGNLDVTRVECRLEDLIKGAAERAQQQPYDLLEIYVPDDLPTIYVDRRRIEVVLRNLIENAVKYGGDHSPIQVSAQVQNGQVIVRVEDEGPGIPVEHSQKIFESFYQLENGLTRQVPGAGLGLAISRGFVRAHGGDIWVEPRTKGACLAFSLPLFPQSQGIHSNYPTETSNEA